MKVIDRLPDLKWTELAERQIDKTGGDRLIKMSHVAYQLGDAAVVGLIYETLTSPPWLWFALARNTTMRDLIDFRRAQEYIPQGTFTAVETDDPIAVRFAEFFGFVATLNYFDNDGHTMLVMRKA